MSLFNRDAAGDAARRFTGSGVARRLIPLTFSIGMGLLGLFLAHTWKTGQERTYERKKQALLENYRAPEPVVVAARDIPLGGTIEASSVATAEVPTKFIQPYSVRSANDLIGKVAIAPIAEGEQILTNKVRKQDDLPTDSLLSGMTPKGKRAITLVFDTISGVGGFVRPGDKVDVLWTLKLPGAKAGEDQVATMTLFQEVSVLAVGTDLSGRQSNPAHQPGERTRETGQPVSYFATLALTPQETSSLLFAREQGRIQLSLRNRGETGAVAVAPSNIQTLLEAQLGLKPQAPPPEPVMYQVEIYKGLKRDVMALAEEE
jgi:pilus assembly protein CpaB